MKAIQIMLRKKKKEKKKHLYNDHAIKYLDTDVRVFFPSSYSY